MRTSGSRPVVGSRGVTLALLGTVALVGQLAVAGPASAAPYTGGFSPTIIGQRADLNGDGVVNGRDDANAFYGDTHIIDGQLDCNDWVEPNDGTDGDDTITDADDCTLIGVDGTADGVTIEVENGLFQVGNGPLPFVFNATEPDNPDIGDSDFAWSAIEGRVDSNGDESIEGDDCHFGLIGEDVDVGLGEATDGADILGSDEPTCGFATPQDPADDGLVDLNSDEDITAAGDTCTDGCFFGHDVDTGVVQAKPTPTPTPTPTPPAPAAQCAGRTATHVGTNANDTIVGTSGDDVVVARGGNDTIRTLGGDDLICAGPGRDTVRAGSRNDRVLGQGGNDFLLGQGARDRINGGAGRDRIKGGSGRDTLRGQGGRDTVRGQGGADKLHGGPARDLCNGGAGIDTARACEIEQLIP
jgi:Ca2+-binding RTX toxin-like protein